MPKPDYSADIASALASEGGHLSVGLGGFTLHYRCGVTLSGYDCDAIKAQSIAARLPVIDSRLVELGAALQLAVNGPLVAVGREPDPAPWHSHERHDRTRSTSKAVTVDRQALIHILMVHARMLETLRKAGEVDIAEPDDQHATREDRTSRSSRSGPRPL